MRAVVFPALALLSILLTSCSSEPTQTPAAPADVTPTPDISATVSAAISATSAASPTLTPATPQNSADAPTHPATSSPVPVPSPVPTALATATPFPVRAILPATDGAVGIATTTPCRGGRRSPPQSVFLNFEEGPVGAVVTVGGAGFNCGTIVEIWRDADGDGVFDAEEEYLGGTRVQTDNRFSAIFVVTSPPFVFGEGSTDSNNANKVNAADSSGNTINPSLPYFSTANIPTFRLIPGTPTPVPTPTPIPVTTPIPSFKPRVERAFPNLSFRLQTNLLQPVDGQNLIFVSELSGRIMVFANDQDTKDSQVFLDMSDRVNNLGPEFGLLGLVFDPAYKNNGRFYVYYSAQNPSRMVLSRFSVFPNNPMQADADSELVLMEIPGVSGHDGGQLAFGPDDYLYISVGDGSTGRRVHPNSANGQDGSTLRGSLLRIDVSGESDIEPYLIPPDNPFVGVAGIRPEIWAYGLRNPWRFSFDRETGNLWLGDVGSSMREEINLIPKGRNYGWSVIEGSHCFEPDVRCGDGSLEPPLVEVSRRNFCAVIGGHVFRGRDIPPLVGAYVYADFCTGQIFGAWYDGYSGAYHQLLLDTDINISSFGEDLAGNIYILSGSPGGGEVDSLHPIFRLRLAPRE